MEVSQVSIHVGLGSEQRLYLLLRKLVLLQQHLQLVQPFHFCLWVHVSFSQTLLQKVWVILGTKLYSLWSLAASHIIELRLEVVPVIADFTFLVLD